MSTAEIEFPRRRRRGRLYLVGGADEQIRTVIVAAFCLSESAKRSGASEGRRGFVRLSSGAFVLMFLMGAQGLQA
jgi:hypothetical protein